MKIPEQRLKQIINEEIADAHDRRSALVSTQPFVGREEDSLNPEWDKASKIKSDLVRLADDLEKSESDNAAQLSRAIVQDLFGAVAAMESRLNEKYAAASGGAESDEEALHLSAPSSQQEIDRLAYGARTGRWRK